ncbi:MAG: CHAT domain-containing protein, partial [Sphingobium sp.]
MRARYFQTLVRPLGLSLASSLARAAWLAPLGMLVLPTMASAQPLSVRNSFRVGSSGVLCSAQIAPADKRLSGLFDRAYRLTCRDAAGAVGSVIAVRHDVDPASAAAVASTSSGATCGAAESMTIEGIGRVDSLLCRDDKASIDYRRYSLRRGETRYVAEGLAGYDPVLRLALASIVTDRVQPGNVSVASTEVADAAAFARVQAGSLDAEGARAEAYYRNNDARFGESAEFFELLADRTGDKALKAELVANAGLQQSNLGNFSSARALFLRAEQGTARSDGITQRLLRNYRTIDLLNQRFAEAALTVLDAPMVAVDDDYDVAGAKQGVVSLPLAEQINRENRSLQRLGGIESGLTPMERAATLDAQAAELRGIALLQQGKLDEADASLQVADKGLLAIREGRLTGALWMRAQIAMERATVAEARQQNGRAAELYRGAIAMLEGSHPETPVLLAARARQAGFLARSGDKPGALVLFASVIEESEKISDSSSALRDLLQPYFALLVESDTPESAAALFRAAQSLQRPGVANTQAVLARELSEGDSEASSLFRLASARTRDIGRAEVELTRLTQIAAPTPADQEQLVAIRQTLDGLRAEQTALTARLSAFPRYKILAPTSVSLGELQGKLGEGEAYYKLAIIGDDAYAIFTDRTNANIYKLDRNRGALEDAVGQIRDSIVRIEDGQAATYPFDIALARSLYVSLFGPVAGRMDAVHHLIFEPDGPLLQLPPGLLVTDDASVAAYQARIAKPKADEFDMRGTAWLGRGRHSTIAVSPRAFLDVRSIAPSKASMAYLGLGNNAVPAAFPAGRGTDACDWSLATWQSPINPAELKLAGSMLRAAGSRLLTGAAFSDTALMQS